MVGDETTSVDDTSVGCSDWCGPHLDRITVTLYAAQTVGTRLVFRLLKATVGFAPQSNSVDMVQSIGLMGMVLGNRGMYEGPTEMALLYR